MIISIHENVSPIRHNTLALKFKINTDLWRAQLVLTILQEEKDWNSVCTPGLATATVNIFEDMDENNADEKDKADFDD